MGKVLNDLRKSLLRIKIGQRDNRALVALGQRVIDFLTTNIADYPTPDVPVATLQTAVDDLRDAGNKTNFKRAHGTAAELLDTKNKHKQLRSLLTAELNYVYNLVNTTAVDPVAASALMALSGFAFRKVRARRPLSQMVKKVQQNNDKVNNPDQYRLKWAKPNGGVKGQPVDGYQIEVNGVIVASTTATNYTFPSLNANKVTGHIYPFNARGRGKGIFFSMTKFGV